MIKEYERRNHTSMRNYPTEEEKEIIVNLYKCHFTAREVAEQLRFGYQTIQNYFRSFKLLDIEKYNRLDLIPEDIAHDAQCHS